MSASGLLIFVVIADERHDEYQRVKGRTREERGVTYYNANVYRDEPTQFAHDECLPDSEFKTTTLSNGDVHRQQRSPWNWAPVYGAPEPCSYCGRPVK